MTSRLRLIAGTTAVGCLMSALIFMAVQAAATPQRDSSLCSMLSARTAAAALKSPVRKHKSEDGIGCQWTTTDDHQGGLDTRELAIDELPLSIPPITWITTGDALTRAHEATVIPGIGDRAYWLVNAELPGAGYKLSVLKGDRIFMISLKGQTEPLSLAAAKIVAREMLRHVQRARNTV